MSQSAQDIEAVYERAARAELDKSYDKAFQLYIQAAQAYLQRARTVADERDRGKCKTAAGKCLERAERIKAVKKDLAPVIRNPFAHEEQAYILEKSSVVHDLRFPIHNEHNSADRNSSDLDAQPPTPQTDVVWKTPHGIFPSISLASPSLLPHEIMQNVITDCSVCTSIAVCLQHHRRFSSKVGLSGMRPADERGYPQLSENGRYTFRFFFNGAYRNIHLNDHLPFHPDGTPIFVTTSPKFDLWPSLLEKSYMKLMGGYDFPGSNSSVDIHCFTGWIPEHIEIRSASFESEKTWSRMIENYTSGKCILTLGTGRREPSYLFVGDMQLLPTHSYAVIDVREDDEGRWMRVLNPWHSSSPPPRVSSGDDDSIERGLRDMNISSGNRIADISWTDICSVFDGIYVNWDPQLFAHDLSFHGLWRPKSEKTKSRSVHSYMRLNVESAKAGDEVWVLLTRHIVDKSRQEEYIAIHVQPEETGAQNGDSLGRQLKGVYTSSTHALARYVIPEVMNCLAIVASYEGDYEDVAFTIQVFSNLGISWIMSFPEAVFTHKVCPLPPNTSIPTTTMLVLSNKIIFLQVDGLLTSKNAGGNCTYPTFMHNPQYRLRVHPDKKASPANDSRGVRSVVRAVAEGARDVPLNVSVVWSRGERTYDLSQGDVLASSGAYSFGIAHTSASLLPGEYNVILSTFEPGQRGPFSLQFTSSTRVDVEPIPSEGAGMFCKSVRGAWEINSARGAPAFGLYTENPTYEIDVKAATQLKVRLQLTKPLSSIALNATIFTSSENHTLGRQIATSGPYTDTISGAATPLVSVTPGKYLLVVSTYDPGIKVSFMISVFTKTSDVQVALLRR
ncbi:cysteine proteinase [Rickenella mellea]|uniref:Cysteine proteinase n=1 Tax=Rickenella mellea TaxID=50990 RepID=A0A4Y7Q6Q2_9AGAM|nr:cysteine proteinase [Rickenella mellea]